MALLGGTIPKAAQALTAAPLGIAFVLGRRRTAATSTATVALTIAAYEAVNRLLHPQGITHPGAAVLALFAGFIGNEWATRYRIPIGRKIGLAALVADDLHARTDGFTSLALLLGAALG